jgi:hypothetical protein
VPFVLWQSASLGNNSTRLSTMEPPLMTCARGSLKKSCLLDLLRKQAQVRGHGFLCPVSLHGPHVIVGVNSRGALPAVGFYCIVSSMRHGGKIG